jgi:hypothetical protein
MAVSPIASVRQAAMAFLETGEASVGPGPGPGSQQQYQQFPQPGQLKRPANPSSVFRSQGRVRSQTQGAPGQDRYGRSRSAAAVEGQRLPPLMMNLAASASGAGVGGGAEGSVHSNLLGAPRPARVIQSAPAVSRSLNATLPPLAALAHSLTPTAKQTKRTPLFPLQA